MHYDPVDCSMLDGVAYDDATSTLRVRFKNGTVYEYSEVPAAVYRRLMTATSSSIYFDSIVNEAGYWFRLVS
jgi:hypothetical protein